MTTDADTDIETDTTDYGSMLETLDVAIEEAREKIESGRIYDNDNERTRIKWVRCLAYTVNVRRQVANDRDLEELAEEIEAIKEQQNQSQRQPTHP